MNIFVLFFCFLNFAQILAQSGLMSQLESIDWNAEVPQEALDCIDVYKAEKDIDNKSWTACEALEKGYLACGWDEECEGKKAHHACTEAYVKENAPARAEECNEIRNKLGMGQRWNLDKELGNVVN